MHCFHVATDIKFKVLLLTAPTSTVSPFYARQHWVFQMKDKYIPFLIQHIFNFFAENCKTVHEMNQSQLFNNPQVKPSNQLHV